MRDFQKPGRSAVLADTGMVATSHPLASQVALETLKRGGTAADAAVAGAVLLGLLEPAMTGIGGDCFVLTKPAGTEDIEGLNGSGRAPAALSSEALRDAGHSTMPIYGDPASVTLPGAIDAFDKLLAKHGRLGWEDVLEPSIRYFEAGVPVAPRVAYDWQEAQGNLSGAARQHYLADDAPLGIGDRFALSGQAEVLRRVAKSGLKAFYEGEVAEDMVASLTALGGVHTLEDFAAVEASDVTPISGMYRGSELVELPPNGQGATALLMAKILERFDIASMEPFGAARVHLEAEAAKLAYNARDRFIADPENADVKLAHMLSDETAAKLAAMIDPNSVIADVQRGTEAVHTDTIYLTVVDKDRMAVSLIYSIFKSFGSGIASDKFGILFQNRGAGFTLEAGHPNEAAGGKRPMHTIIPAMLRQNDRLVMPFGVMGGAYQPNGHMRFLSNMLDFGMDMQTAIDAPRSFGALGPLELESGFDPAIWGALRDIGHSPVATNGPTGGAQAIWIGEDGVLTGASDPRKDGIALGY